MRSMVKNGAKAAAFAASMMAASSAFASDGTIHIAGSIVGTTCTVGAIPDVILPTLGVNSLGGENTTAGRTQFSISLSDCSTGLTSVKAFFENNNVNIASSDLDITTGSGNAEGIRVRLLNSEQEKILLANSAPTQDGSSATISNSTETLNFYAEYVVTSATPVAGSVVTSTTFTLLYS